MIKDDAEYIEIVLFSSLKDEIQITHPMISRKREPRNSRMIAF